MFSFQLFYPILARPVVQYLIAFGLGCLAVLAFAPFEQFWLMPFLLAGLLAINLGFSQSIRQASITGWCFGFGLFATGVSWVFVSLHTFGGMPAWLAGLATVLFCAFIALYPACVMALLQWIRQRRPLSLLRAALVFAVLWAFADWLRGWLFTGFPWLSIGYSQLSRNLAFSPLSAYFPLLGVFGVSLLTTFCAGLLLGKTRGWLILLCILGGGWALQQVQWTKPIGQAINVALVQGNIPQDLKWDAERYQATLNTYQLLVKQSLTAPSQPKLIILPETAYPSYLQDVPRYYLDELKSLAQLHQADIVFGAITGTPKQYFNSAVSMGISEQQRYHKSHLVPFGESVPWGFRWLMNLTHIPMTDFTPGDNQQHDMQLQGVRLALNICYEDAFGEQIIGALPSAHILANISNTAWFGDSLAQPQHLQIARARALETGRPMLRATNTGMTAAITPNGMIDDRLAPFTTDILFSSVQPYEGTTPYSRWGNLAFLLLAASFLLNVLRKH